MGKEESNKPLNLDRQRPRFVHSVPFLFFKQNIFLVVEIIERTSKIFERSRHQWLQGEALLRYHFQAEPLIRI